MQKKKERGETYKISTHDAHPIPTFQQIHEPSAFRRARRVRIETVRVPSEVINPLGGHALVTLDMPPFRRGVSSGGERGGGGGFWVFQVIVVIWRGGRRRGSEDGSFES